MLGLRFAQRVPVRHPPPALYRRRPAAARAHGTAARCTVHARAPRRGAGVLGECGDRRVSGKPQTRIGSLVESHYDTAYRYRRAARVSRPDHVAHEPSRGHGSVSARSGSLPPPRRVPGPGARSTADGARRWADRAHVSQARSGPGMRHATRLALQAGKAAREPWEQAARPERLDALRRSTGSLSPPTADPRPPPPRTVLRL